MSRSLTLIAAAVVIWPPPLMRGQPSDRTLFPHGRETFLVENDLAYARCLDLLADGTYRQIDRDEHGSEEVDRGTWEQTSEGELHLHAEHHALRFHALVAGPVSVPLQSGESRDALPRLAQDIHRLLGSTSDDVFAAQELGRLGSPGYAGVRINVGAPAETCSRQDLEALARQIRDFIGTEKTGEYVLTPIKAPGGGAVYALVDDVFQAADLPQVQHDFALRADRSLPFYFAPVTPRVFARTVGTWREPRLPGYPN